MSEETQQEIRKQIIEEVQINGELIIDEETFPKLSDKLSEEDAQEFNDKLDELDISKLTFSKNDKGDEIYISADIDEFPNKDEGYEDRVCEIGEFLGLRCYPGDSNDNIVSI